ncbi:hypothetical protein GCM10018963_32410 [Saccharothrix longispora]
MSYGLQRQWWTGLRYLTEYSDLDHPMLVPWTSADPTARPVCERRDTARALYRFASGRQGKHVWCWSHTNV